jgi:ankyrin repeat protein
MVLDPLAEPHHDMEQQPSGDPKQRPALWLASKNGFYDVVEMLLAEPDVDVEEIGGRYNTTPLQVAATHYRLSICKILLDASASTNSRDDRGLTAYQLAYSESHLNLMHILQQSPDFDAFVHDTIGVLSPSCKENNRHLRLCSGVSECEAE